MQTCHYAFLCKILLPSAGKGRCKRQQKKKKKVSVVAGWKSVPVTSSCRFTALSILDTHSSPSVLLHYKGSCILTHSIYFVNLNCIRHWLPALKICSFQIYSRTQWDGSAGIRHLLESVTSRVQPSGLTLWKERTTPWQLSSDPDTCAGIHKHPHVLTCTQTHIHNKHNILILVTIILY